MLSIPKSHIEHLVAINGIGEKERSLILAAIVDVGIKNNLNDLAEYITNKTALDRKIVLSAFVIAGSILNTASRLNKTKERILEELIETAAAKTEDFDLTDETNEFIKVLVSNEKILASVKCERITSEFDSRFESIKILTDLRPVFSEDATKICHSAIIHTIDLSVVKNEETVSYYVAINDEDIDSIISALERAKLKAKTLSSVIEGI
jgi:hypothetical protein